MTELATLIEQHGLILNIDYNPFEEVYNIDIYDGKVHVYNSFDDKGSLVVLLQCAYNATIEYIKKRQEI